MPDNLKIQFKLIFAGRDEGEEPPPTTVHAFTSQGKHLASSRVKNGKARLEIPDTFAGQSIRLLFAPPLDEDDASEASLVRLSRLNPLERRLRIDPGQLEHEFELLEPTWRDWFRCRCVVRGRLVKRVNNPDGGFDDLPICHARVTICEVDPLPILIDRLPDLELVRLRDELLEAINRPLPEPPRPDPPLPDPPDHIGPPDLGGLPRRLVHRDRAVSGADFRPIAGNEPATPVARADFARGEPLSLSPEDSARLRMLTRTREVPELRNLLTELYPVVLPWLCIWDWLEPWLRYRKDRCRTVEVDETGRFETVFHYPCFGDRPDLYFEAEQWQGSSWVSIYRPSIRCHTHWNYACGSEVTLRVTSPHAVPCHPDEPVVPPSGEDSWVMPFSVGSTRIWGDPPGSAGAAPTGWVKTGGFTDYGPFTDAPFGARLGFRLSHSANIPDGGARYFRWSWKRVGSTDDFEPMTLPVTRRYVKDLPGANVSFPSYLLGPKAVPGSSESGLVEFKPQMPPPPDSGDPPGTTTYWPSDNFAGDIYAGFWDTQNVPPDVATAAGQYRVRLEVFDEDGNRVAPGASTFRFIVPAGVAADGVTILTRLAEPSEIVDDGFEFLLQVDNNPCTAVIHPPDIGGSVVTDDCGFLRYTPGALAPVNVTFEASHPNGHAILSFFVRRGATTLPVTQVGGAAVSALTAPPYTGDGAGNFGHGFTLAELLCGPGTSIGCCTHAAFAERLHVDAKATTGNGSPINAYDAGDLRAFALAPVEDDD